MSTTVTRDAEGTVTGNTYDKYGSTNPVVKRLMANFEATLEELFTQAAPRSILDVGCGEGVLTYQWARRPGIERIVGIDLDDPQLHETPPGPVVEVPGGVAEVLQVGAAGHVQPAPQRLARHAEHQRTRCDARHLS